MSGDSKSSGWVNNFAKMWQKSSKDGYFLSIPLAEAVTIKLQRKTQDGFVTQEVTLVPQTNEKGYSSVMLTMKKPEAYTNRGGDIVKPNEKLKFELSLPPQSEGTDFGPEPSFDSNEEIPF